MDVKIIGVTLRECQLRIRSALDLIVSGRIEQAKNQLAELYIDLDNNWEATKHE